MRDLQDCADKLARLIELLTVSAGFELLADIRSIDARRGSDEARLQIHFTGRDTSLLTANNGQVLNAIETLATDILGLSAAEGETIQCDAGNFLADRKKWLHEAAGTAIRQVRCTGKPHVFPPMIARDRRLLEQALGTSGLWVQILGNQSARWVVLLPNNVTPAFETVPIHCSSIR